MSVDISCPNDHGEMALRKIGKETIFKGEKINYQFDTYVCDECGANIGTIKQAAATQNAIADAYRKKIGLLTGEEIKRKRAKLKWSQKNLSEMAGVGIASIKRWENGILQTKSMDRALRSAFKGAMVGNRYTGNRTAISIPRIKLVMRAFEKELGLQFLEEGDKLLFDGKYLWYADMLAFDRIGKSITGSHYAALPFGPQLNNYSELIDLIREADEADAEPLTDEEKMVIVRVAATFPTKHMVYDAAHREVVWKKMNKGDLIPYTAAEELTEV